MANDFNINLLGFEQNKKVKNFVNINIWPQHDPNHKQTDTRY